MLQLCAHIRRSLCYRGPPCQFCTSVPAANGSSQTARSSRGGSLTGHVSILYDGLAVRHVVLHTHNKSPSCVSGLVPFGWLPAPPEPPQDRQQLGNSESEEESAVHTKQLRALHMQLRGSNELRGSGKPSTRRCAVDTLLRGSPSAGGRIARVPQRRRAATAVCLAAAARSCCTECYAATWSTPRLAVGKLAPRPRPRAHLA
jgi:hypothetical protein